jgi:hypothetical protein
MSHVPLSIVLTMLMLTVPLGIAVPQAHLTAPDPAVPDGTTIAVEGPPIPSCLPADVPFLVDACGDTMTGPLVMLAPIRFPGGDLDANTTLAFGGVPLCLAGSGQGGCISGVTAGFGLLGGGNGGLVTLDADPAVLQRRVTGACPAPSAIRTIHPDGSVTCEPNLDWHLGGNAGTTPGANFLGTTDHRDLQLKVNGVRALLVQSTFGTANLIAGWEGNGAAEGIHAAVIAGGGAGGAGNSVRSNYAVVSGGYGNGANGFASTVTGGEGNGAIGPYSVVSGAGNGALGYASAVSGGLSNRASGDGSAVPGGFGASATHYAEIAHAAGAFATAGDAQHMDLVMRVHTAEDGPVRELSQYLTMPPRAAWSLTIDASARSVVGSHAAAYKFVCGASSNDAGTATLLGCTNQMTLETDPNWSLTVAATGNRLSLTASNPDTGQGIVRWVASVSVTQVLA